ncbi:MAG: DUF4091 domain-containing protein [Clostridia bacterium]|nr:DUF4091 domain-containing protein [Clostridia bacterium]
MKTALLSSLAKVFPDELAGGQVKKLTLFQNERGNFQLAYKLDSPGDAGMVYPVIKSALPLAEYRVGYVPVVRACPAKHDNGFVRTTPGLYPDPLFRRQAEHEVEDEGRFSTLWVEKGEKELLTAVGDSWQSLWLTVNEEGKTLDAGEYAITIRLVRSTDPGEFSEERLLVEILPESLGEQTLLVTNWFYADCLADHYGVEVFSERHFEIMASFMKAAADHGQNMLLLPAFTPPLDTSVGKERKTAQLVGVKVENGEYSFDFMLLECFIKTALEAGITHFEHTHMFTQWGAENAPKVMATVDGVEKRLFGWETDAKGEEYVAFLRAYFKALFPVLEKLGVKEKTWFHTSDEPDENTFESYKEAAAIMREVTGGATLFDALSHYQFAAENTTDVPVVAENSPDMEKFIQSGKPFWAYYTGGQVTENNANRLISNLSVRNRMLGVMLYATGASGFLHWGYNFYYDILSHGHYDPNAYPGTYVQHPGTSLIVYPSPDGKAVPSLRMKVFEEAMSDYRALSKLESLTSREDVMKIVEKHFGKLGYSYDMSEEALMAFREEINDRIR